MNYWKIVFTVLGIVLLAPLLRRRSREKDYRRPDLRSDWLWLAMFGSLIVFFTVAGLGLLVEGLPIQGGFSIGCALMLSWIVGLAWRDR